MTDKEIEKEAEEIYLKTDKEFMYCQDEGEIFTLGYLAGAEPREKRIAELEAQIEKMKNCKNCANYMISGKCPSFFRIGWCKNWDLAD